MARLRPELARLPREVLERLVAEEVRDLLGVRSEQVFSSVRCWRQGLPQPDLGHAQRLEAMPAAPIRCCGGGALGRT